MRDSSRHLLAVTFGILSLTGIPYLIYLVLHQVVDISGSPAQKSPTEPTVSIVLPTYNEASIIETKLEDILALDYPMEKIEVVVADASDDDTPMIVEKFFTNLDAPDLTILHDDERRGVATALNEAFSTVNNELIFRTDADSKLAPDVLREAAANLSDPTIGAVTGQQSEVLGDSKVESDYRGILTKIQSLESHLDSTFIFHGPCFAFRAEDFMPIDPNSLADDTELALRIRRAGKRVVMDPKMRFTESSVSEFSKRRQRKDRRAMGLLKLLIQNRDMLGRYGLYGTVVLPFNWWFMIVSPWLLAASVALATVIGILLAGPFGLVVPGVIVVFAWAGQSEDLGPFQPLYAVFDSQVSLLFAAVGLLRNEDDGMWDLDRESREYFE